MKKKLVFFSLALLLMGCGVMKAETAKEPPIAHPTLQELYENCKAALMEADAGNEAAFMQSSCNFFMQGIAAGRMLQFMSIPMPEQEKYKADIKLCKSDASKKKYGNYNKDILVGSVAFARKFADAYEKKINSGYFESEGLEEHLRHIPSKTILVGWYAMLGDMVFGDCDR